MSVPITIDGATVQLSPTAAAAIRQLAGSKIVRHYAVPDWHPATLQRVIGLGIVVADGPHDHNLTPLGWTVVGQIVEAGR